MTSLGEEASDGIYTVTLKQNNASFLYDVLSAFYLNVGIEAQFLTVGDVFATNTFDKCLLCLMPMSLLYLGTPTQIHTFSFALIHLLLKRKVKACWFLDAWNRSAPHLVTAPMHVYITVFVLVPETFNLVVFFFKLCLSGLKGQVFLTLNSKYNILKNVDAAHFNVLGAHSVWWLTSPKKTKKNTQHSPN